MKRHRRFWLLLLLILLPLFTILFVQYRSLRSLEQTLPGYRRDLLLSFLQTVIEDVMNSYRTQVEQTLTVPEAVVTDATGRIQFQALLNQAAAHFNRQRFSGVNRLFVAQVDETKTQCEIFFYDPVRQTLTTDQQSPEKQTISVVCAAYLIYLRDSANTQSEAVGNERDPAVPLIIKPVRDNQQRIAALIGMTLNQEWFSQEAVPGAIRRHLPFFFPDEAQDAMVSLYDSSGRVAWATQSVLENKIEASLPFRPFHIRYTLGISMRTQNVKQWAQRNFLLNLALSILMSLVMIGGLALGMRAAAEEMRVSQMKTDFVANVSHELRTPLTSICALAEMLKYDRVRDWEKVREYGGHIAAQGKRLSQLVNNILDFSRIESGQREYRFENADLHSIVNEAMAAVWLRLKQSEHTIRLEITEPLPRMRLDPDAFALALSNLLDNALKYSSCGTEIVLRLSRESNMVTISIADQGPGIAPDEQEKIFEKFYRISTGMVHDVKGSGLGLAIVRHIIQAHQGGVSVSSEPGRGNVFTIRLPLADTQSEGKGQSCTES